METFKVFLKLKWEELYRFIFNNGLIQILLWSIIIGAIFTTLSLILGYLLHLVGIQLKDGLLATGISSLCLLILLGVLIAGIETFICWIRDNWRKAKRIVQTRKAILNTVPKPEL
jgi:ABC-type spermidine/putrescine transport system permease subunit II